MTDYNRRFNDNDPCWLIKVDAHISGPYSFNEVVSRLVTGTLAPHHEAMSPLDRWRSLQSQVQFVAAIEKLRRRQEEAVEHTLTKTERSQITKTMDLTPDQLTPTPFQETLTPPPSFKSTPVVQRRPTEFSVPSTTQQTRRISLLYLGVGALAFVLVLFYFLRETAPGLPQVEKKYDFFTYFDQGLSAKKTAHWSEALKNFSLAHQLNSRDVDLTMEMAPLLIQLDGQTSYARSLVEKALIGQYKKETILLGKTLLGLSYSYDSQQQPDAYSSALKMFNEALQEDETEYVPALINKGWLLVTQGRYREAEGELVKTINKNPYAQTGVLYLVESYLLEGSKSTDKSSYQKALQLTSQLVNHKIYDGQQEIQFFHSFLLSKLGGDRMGIQRFLQNALSLDPDLTADHVHTPLLDWRGYQWKRFDFVCQDLVKSVRAEQAQLLQFMCKYKGQGVLAAQQFIDGWAARFRKDANAHVASAIVSQTVGELDKARNSLKTALSLGAQDRLYYQILSKVCLKQKDVSCLKEILPTLQKVSPLHAYTAQVAIQSGDTQSFLRGIKESPNYAPLLSLQK